jgi:CRP/FNR family cyclic AMP-dependent transcriptional regulator
VEPRPKSPTPYGLPIVDTCLTCVVREDRLFCGLSPSVLSELNGLRRTAFYPQGALLYVEGELPRGLFIVCAGRAKLSATGREGKSVTFREVMPGEVMGLSCVVAHRPYQTSAQTVEPSEVSMVESAEFMDFLHRHNETALRVAQHLSMELHAAWAQTRMLALAPNARAKLAQLLLMWAGLHGHTSPEGLRFPLNMTQEAVGEAIGATRETVSRLLSDFQRRQLIRVHGSAVLLLDPEQLRSIGGA